MSHEDVLATVVENLDPVLDESPDGVYVYVDDANRHCNERLAEMFGYSVEEWATAGNFLETFVAEEDRQRFSETYQGHVAALSRPITFRFKAQRRDGSTFQAETDMVPLCFHGHPVAYHFVRDVPG